MTEYLRKDICRDRGATVRDRSCSGDGGGRAMFERIAAALSTLAMVVL
jgi:hypothetical protein